MKRSNKTFLGTRDDEFGSLCWYAKTDLKRPDDWWELETSEKKALTLPKDEGVIRSTVRITDCGKAVELSFYAKTSEEYEERIAKIDTLIRELTDFRDSYIDVYADSKVTDCKG